MHIKDFQARNHE